MRAGWLAGGLAGWLAGGISFHRVMVLLSLKSNYQKRLCSNFPLTTTTGSVKCSHRVMVPHQGLVQANEEKGIFISI
ncbi:hypothetical protein DPMN_033557 [Dreissena polymorpha]|uniref:Uncharacterized protein n=1 Tax=Dreissena polymorpha TaxID=45954 RepID=A0A9D4C3V5_DREPO|nr:hypothetical protein DPMN_059302 [Dreissena polymorpha]KAH3870373.1 hypothetical protein DPMN_033557 [Dreissena polymorpha]